MKKVIIFKTIPTDGETYLPATDKIISGNPRQTIWMHYTDPTGQFCTGIWRGEPGKWRIHYTEEEFCQMTAGVSILTNDAGEAFTLRAGDSFVVPKGFSGTWEVVETSTKRFVIFEAATGIA
jgi:uncharacterized cupin superfamily protein